MVATYKINLENLKTNYLTYADFGSVYFPIKTNHNSIILKQLKRLGCGFETDSVEHIKKVYSPNIAHKILYSNVAKSFEDILWTIKHKISYYTVDDEQTLRQIINLAIKYKLPKLKINIRLNVYECFKKEFDLKGAIDSRLGAFIGKAKDLLKIINEENRINIEKGFSFYIQAEIHNDEDCLIKMLNHIIKHFDRDIGLSFINLGGGATKERLTRSMQTIKKTLEYFNAKGLVLEPGRYMVGNVEDLYLPCIRVVDNIEINNEIVATLQVGIYHGLIDTLLHKRNFEIYVVNQNDLEKLEQALKSKVNLVLRGPTADSLDVLGIFAMPKSKINNDTVFVIKNVGAYVEVFNSAFSGKIKCKYVIDIEN